MLLEKLGLFLLLGVPKMSLSKVFRDFCLKLSLLKSWDYWAFTGVTEKERSSKFGESSLVPKSFWGSLLVTVIVILIVGIKSSYISVEFNMSCRLCSFFTTSATCLSYYITYPSSMPLTSATTRSTSLTSSPSTRMSTIISKYPSATLIKSWSRWLA